MRKWWPVSGSMGAFPFAPAPHGIRGNPSKCWRSFRQSEAKFIGSFGPYQTHKDHTKSQHVQPDKSQTRSRQKMSGNLSGCYSSQVPNQWQDLKISSRALANKTIHPTWRGQIHDRPFQVNDLPLDGPEKIPKTNINCRPPRCLGENCDPRLDASAGNSQRINPWLTRAEHHDSINSRRSGRNWLLS